jgi:hypothetical protein
MNRYDVFEETALTAHFALSDGGCPTWETVPEAWGSPWMQEAIREGLVATILEAPCEAAWYYGGLTIRPQRSATEAAARPHGLGPR